MKDEEYEKCQFCEGCGQIASDDRSTPWRKWLELPIEIRQAGSGIIKPLLCPVCKGKGKVSV